MGLRETAPAETFGDRLHDTDGSLGPDSFKSSRATQSMRAPGPVVLLGAPGVGKGTQAEALAKLWSVPTISTGEILRTNVLNSTALGNEAKEVMKRGGLVPNHLITEMVASRLRHPDVARGFILDGFPRTIQQAQWLDRHLAIHHRKTPLVVVHMYMDPQKIVERIIHRRICPFCKRVYNSLLQPPKRSGHCDHDNAALVQRSDDHVEVFRERLDVFKRETEPLIEHYRHHPLFIMAGADRPASIVTKRIVAAIAGRRRLMERIFHAGPDCA